MNRQDIINDIALYLEKQNQNNNTNIDLPLVVEELNIWGQYAIGYEGNNTFDKAASGNTIALASAGAGSKKKIPVLFGYRGL